MDEHTFKVLEFDKVRDLVSTFCLSSLGKEMCQEMLPLVDEKLIQEKLKAASELKEVLLFEERFPLNSVKDIRPYLNKLQSSGTFLEPKELLDLAETLIISKSVFSFLEPKKRKYQTLWDILSEMKPEDELIGVIEKVVDSSAQIKDTASKELRQIRQRKSSTRNKILDKLRSLLDSKRSKTSKQEDIITIREGRYVIPMETEEFSRSKGIVHDRSSSGATFFVEPFSVVELNNELRELDLEEKREIEKILLGISNLIRQDLEEIKQIVETLQLIDFIHGKARFSIEFKANAPRLNTKGFVNLIKARHPLLEKKIREMIVPLDLELGEDFNTLIITGPNTGGKTVALKTIGLLTLMAQAGMHIPVEDTSQIAIFDKIYADIGDEQSIEMSISTFSSHISRVIKAVSDSDTNTLVLLDELGAGTDPKEGVALAEAVLINLSARNAKTVITTHYGILKLLPQNHPQMRNASLEFDRETFKPTYNFRPGLPGSSYAIEVAQRLGMPKDVLDKASELVGTQERDLSLLLESLEKDLKRVNQDRRTLEEQKKISDELLNLYQDKLRKIELKEKELERKSLEEARRLVDQTKIELERLVAQIRSTQADKELVKKTHQFIDKTEKEIKDKLKISKDKKTEEQNIEKGDVVWIDSLKVQGEVISKQGDQVRVRAANFTYTVGREEISKVETAKEKPVQSGSISSSEAQGASLEVDLRGLYGDEAVEVVDKCLDRAYVSNLNTLSIIHGKGTGALRKRINLFLRRHPRVDSFRLGNWNEGGSGVTVVKLKE
ncbi:MAG TPA: endonuclease MutS2 [candidate division Zixibacteria bacterium]